MDQSIKVALYGFGYAGQTFHAPLIGACADLDLACVISRQAEVVGRALPQARVTDRFEEVLNDPEIGLVVLATPNDGHAEQAKAVLKAGKSVVVDKPFTLTLTEAEALADLAQAQGQLLSVFHNRRWDADFLTLKDLIARDQLGEVRRVESHFNRYRPQVRERWREGAGAGAGLWYDLGPHLLDQALCLFGMPQSLWCDLAILRPEGLAVDYAHAVLTYEGHRVVLHADMVTPAADLRFSVHGAKASWIKNGLDAQEDQLKAGKGPDDEVWGLDARPGQILDGATGETRSLEGPRGAYQAYYEAIAKAMKGRGANPVSPQEAVAVMRLLEAGLTSAQTGQTIRF